jgi:hypothetical protein
VIPLAVAELESALANRGPYAEHSYRRRRTD